MPNYKKKFSRIYDQHINKIYRFIFLKVNSQEVAEDLTSEVFLKTWQVFKKGQEIRNPNAFLYQVAKNELAIHYRKPKFQIVSTDKVNIIDPQPTPEEQHKLKDDIGHVQQVLSQLGEDYQNAIIWRYLDGYSFKEIAQILEKPEGTVRVMLHRALKELKEKMEMENL